MVTACHVGLHIIARRAPQSVAVVECMQVVSTAGAGGRPGQRRARGWGSASAQAAGELDGDRSHGLVAVRMRVAGEASGEVAVVAACIAGVAGTRRRSAGRSRQVQPEGRQQEGRQREGRGCLRQVVSQGQSSQFCLHV